MTTVRLVPAKRREGSRRVTPPRTTQIDDELWNQAVAIAKIRGDAVAAIMRDAVKRYVARHKHLLDEQPRDEA